MTLVARWRVASRVAAGCLVASCLNVPANASDDVGGGGPWLERPVVNAWLDRLADERGLDRNRVAALFEGLGPDRRVLERIARPAERTLEWRDYGPIFLGAEREAVGLAFLAAHRATFDAVEARYGVPREVIAAIIGVETFYGRITGSDRVLVSLATLAFDYPPRADFFGGELAEFLALGTREGWALDEIQGSYAGAMGLPQFISSSYRRYAVDGDGDGRRDLFASVPDAIFSVANYFVENGWRPGEAIAERWTPDDGGRLAKQLVRESLRPRISPATVRAAGFNSLELESRLTHGEEVSVMSFVAGTDDEPEIEYVVGYNNFYAITRYNHSRLYARAVLELARALESSS